MNNRPAFLSVFISLFAALACNLTPPARPPGDATLAGDLVSTLVAQQLTAVATPAPAAAETSTPTPPASDVNALQVVYSKGGNIRLSDGTTSKQLTSSGQDSAPKISDDGLVVAFIRNGELWAVNPDGNHQRALAPASALAALPHDSSGPAQLRQFDFAPRSHDVYLNTTVLGEPFSMPEYNLARVNADSGALQAVLDASQGGGQFVFSPDGKKIALPRNDKINVSNADGTGLKTVFTFPFVMTYSDGGNAYIPEIIWLPDGSGFKTVIPAPDQLGNPSAPTRFMFIPADGGPAARLAEFAASPAFANRPFISPDGSKVLYTKAQGANLELHVIDASTADQMLFWHVASNFGILGWAPDSTHVVYWLDDTRRAWLGSPGGPATPLSDVTFAANVTWVDSQRYLFINEAELRLRALGQPSILIDTGLSESVFDFTLLVK